MSTARQPAVEVLDLSFSYDGENWILKNCNLKLQKGELLVLSGLSGEGKSTLLSCINGIIPNIQAGTLEGEILVEGESIRGKRMSEIANKVGSVLQNADSQIVHARIEDEIAFGCENMSFPPEEISKRIAEACQLMELDPNWPTSTLSGGQKQRLITAATLAMGQRILVFDEPLANLDLDGAHILLKALRRLCQQGYAVMFIEHRLDWVIPYADRVAWMREGKVEVLADKRQALASNLNLIPDNGRIPYNEERLMELDRVGFSAGGRDILKQLSLTIHRGERLVVLGENGCGKTSLLRLLAGLEAANTGRITCFGELVGLKKGSPQWFGRVGFVYQNPNYQLFMPSLQEEVAFQSPSEEHTERYLRSFHLLELKERHPQSLSEGQKRKTTIAAVAAVEPQLLLLDEPTVGQDYASLYRVVESLNELHKRSGMAMVTVTHDYRCAAALADRVIWMHEGQIYRSGGKELVELYFTRNLGTVDVEEKENTGSLV